MEEREERKRMQELREQERRQEEERERLQEEKQVRNSVLSPALPPTQPHLACAYEEMLRLCACVCLGGDGTSGQRGAGEAGGGGVLETQGLLCHRGPGRGGAAH